MSATKLLLCLVILGVFIELNTALLMGFSENAKVKDMGLTENEEDAPLRLRAKRSNSRRRRSMVGYIKEQQQ
uniref:Uncharacterized protein n=1 Tax=Ciona intestinalis TaxID=7719 RepID=H2Y3U1_CIOIN